MRRDLNALADRSFDLLVIGGGIFGAAAALDAAQRGLDVALIERGDFGGSTSAHSFKMVHGGIRYLQHADIYRIRQSAEARRGFLRVAPHLCQPLPIVIPTYGYGLKSKFVLWAGMRAYDGLTMDRNRGIADRSRQVPNCRFMSRDEVVSRYPSLSREGLTGAGIFCDGQMYNPPRLVLAHVQSATALGAVAANYVEAEDWLRTGNRVSGAVACDRIGGERFEIQAKMVLNAAGPYTGHWLQSAFGCGLKPDTPLSRDAYFIVNRPLIDGNCALTLPSQYVDPDARLSRGTRHLFLVPWRGVTLIGVWHKVVDCHPDNYSVTQAELEAWIDEINEAYPAVALCLDDVAMVSAGLVPFGDNRADSGNLRFAHRSRIVDHAQSDGIEGVLTLIGVRYTTGPLEASKLVGQIAARLGKGNPSSRLMADPVRGGNVDDFPNLVKEIESAGVARVAAEALAHNHGACWREVFDVHLSQDRLPNSTVHESEVRFAVSHEMAQSLGDIVFRRTDLLTAGAFDRESLRRVSEVAGETAGWSKARTKVEYKFVAGRLDIARTGRTMLADQFPQLEPVAA